ncbi:MAG: C39 family peptidase [Solirubrobacterales bacterium]
MPSTKTRSAIRQRRRQTRRRRVAGVLVMAAAVTALAVLAFGSTAAESTAGAVRIEVRGKRLAAFDMRRFEVDGRLDTIAFRRAVSRRLPATAAVETGRSRVTYRVDRPATVRRAVALGLAGGQVEAVASPLASRIGARVVKQRYRNNCETAALSSLMSALGTAVSQTQLQSELTRSGPADPSETQDGKVWGDPDQGFVGRVTGGGTAGGFGVYPGPIADLAERYGVRLDDLTDVKAAKLYARVKAGGPVMAWIGLSDGPYGEWSSPGGKRIRVNWGEHVVVLAGISESGDLRVMNPLQGSVERWDQPTFEAKWKLLGRRALATR